MIHMQTSSNMPRPIHDELLKKITRDVGTPVYVYSWDHIASSCRAFRDSIKHQPVTLSYAVKANNNVHLLRRIFAEGFGADVVSGGEFARATMAKCSPDKIVFSGVGKSRQEIADALAHGLFSFNVESLFELKQIEEVAAQYGKPAPICLRINPNIDAKTNPYIATGLYETKFGLSEDSLAEALQVIRKYRHCRLRGLACHIGSQITDLDPIKQALERMLGIVGELRSKGQSIEVLNMGGGLGIDYGQEKAPSVEEYGALLSRGMQGSNLHLVLEPGRALVGNAGVLLTTVMGSKMTPKKRFVIVDAAMTELIRPCLYEAHHEVSVLNSQAKESKTLSLTDIVGPVCESSDFLAKDRQLPELIEGDVLVVHSCGAYGASMGSTYNTRPRPPEVVTEGNTFQLVRRREKTHEIWQTEMIEEK